MSQTRLVKVGYAFRAPGAWLNGEEPAGGGGQAPTVRYARSRSLGCGKILEVILIAAVRVQQNAHFLFRLSERCLTTF